MKQQTNWIFMIGALVLVIALRFVDHPWNFTPFLAFAVLAFGYVAKKGYSYALPIVAFWLSSLYITNVMYASYYEGFTLITPELIWAFAAIAVIGLAIRAILSQKTWSTVIISAVVAPVLFYLVTNFGVWATSGMYTMDFSGLMSCMAAGVPFFRSSLVGTLCFTPVLFAAYQFATNKEVGFEVARQEA